MQTSVITQVKQNTCSRNSNNICALSQPYWDMLFLEIISEIWKGFDVFVTEK